MFTCDVSSTLKEKDPHRHGRTIINTEWRGGESKQSGVKSAAEGSSVEPSLFTSHERSDKQQTAPRHPLSVSVSFATRHSVSSVKKGSHGHFFKIRRFQFRACQNIVFISMRVESQGESQGGPWQRLGRLHRGGLLKWLRLGFPQAAVAALKALVGFLSWCKWPTAVG